MGILQFKRKLYSGNVAKERLKLLIYSERVNCSPDVLNLIHMEILQVVSKYMDIDTKHSSLQIIQENKKNNLYRMPMLYANIPIKTIQTIKD